MEWRELFQEEILNNAREEVRGNSVQDISVRDGQITAKVGKIIEFNVELQLEESTVSKMECSCPFGRGRNHCKHMAAVLLALENSGQLESAALKKAGKAKLTETASDKGKFAAEHIEADTAPDIPVPKTIKAQNAEPQISEEKIKQAKTGLQLSCETEDVLTYAMVHNGAYIVRDICIKNNSQEDIDHLMIHIDSDTGLTEPFALGIEKIKPGEELHFKKLNVSVSAHELASLTERSRCRL